MRKLIHKITAALTCLSIALFAEIAYLDEFLPDRYHTENSAAFSLAQQYLSTSHTGGNASAVSGTSGAQSVSVDLFGLIPIKTVSVSQTEAPNLIASGDTSVSYTHLDVYKRQVIIREDLIQGVDEKVPTMFDYSIHVKNGSMYNTPPCYSIYMCKLVPVSYTHLCRR